MLSTHIQNLLLGLKSYKKSDPYSSDKGPPISINKLTSRAGALYEKLRYLVDYKEEHTLRRNAIQRILKRKLLIEKKEDAAIDLLQELVSGGYLPNNQVSQGVSHDIQQIIDKYLVLSQVTGVSESRILSIVSREIERFLYPHLVEDLVVDAFHNTISNNVKYTGEGLSRDELSIQTYIGCRISLLEDENDTLFYALLHKYFPEFFGVIDRDELTKKAQRFSDAVRAVEGELENPLGQRIAARLKNHSIYFAVLRELIIRYGLSVETLFADSGKLQDEIKKLLNEKYQKQREIVSRAGTRAVIYIFLTKIVLAFIIELPYERIFLGEVDYFALGVNVVFHPLLLLLMVKTIRFPLQKNTNAIIVGVYQILQNQGIKTIYIKPSGQRTTMGAVLGVLYLILFGLSFGLILWVLNSLNFNIVSILLFMLFLTFVSYFGFRIRSNAKKWMVSKESDSFISLLWNFFTIPIVRTGKWLSQKFASINVFMFFMDFVLETPFKMMLGTFDEFISFLREKKEDYK